MAEQGGRMTSTTDDYNEILRVMQLYIDGFNDNDIRKFKEAFHEDAWIFFIDADGVLHRNLISESFERWAAPPSWGSAARFVSVTRVGDAAAVQLHITSRGSNEWIDFHNLLRINGVWKITNKTATHSSRVPSLL
jgi:Putative lumazine-binding